MNVQSSTRRRALFGIYQLHRKGRGGVLTLRQLERDWKQTGLRHSDLDMALADACHRQFLLLKKAHDSAGYELTYLGECAMNLNAAAEPLTFIRDWLTLRRAKLRNRRSAARPENAPHNRRAEDKQNPAKPAE